MPEPVTFDAIRLRDSIKAERKNGPKGKVVREGVVIDKMIDNVLIVDKSGEETRILKWEFEQNLVFRGNTGMFYF